MTNEEYEWLMNSADEYEAWEQKASEQPLEEKGENHGN